MVLDVSLGDFVSLKQERRERGTHEQDQVLWPEPELPRQ